LLNFNLLAMIRKWVAWLLFVAPLACGAQNIDLLILNKNYNEALSQIKQNLDVRPDAELYFKQGLIYRQLLKPMSAERSIENSISLDSTNSRYLAEYADLQTERGNPFKAISFYQRASRYSPDDFNLQYKVGRAFMNTENFAKAYDVFMMIRVKDSTNVFYNKQLGIAALRLGKVDQAIDLFESVLESNPYDFSLYQYLVTLYAMNKDAVHVVRTSDRALYFFPENPAVLLREANSLYAIKEYEEAIPSYERYLSKNDSVFAVLKNYGLCLYFVQENEKSRTVLEQSFYLVSDDPIVIFYLGLVCKKLADFSSSIEYLNMVISDGKYGMTEMYHCLGQVHGLRREFEKSIEALKQAYQCNPEKKEILVEIATTYEEFNPDKKLALNYYNQYLNEAGDSAVNAKYAQERVKTIKERFDRQKK
jgi:tetratricopeptide (TPR) repeat protein